MLAICQITAVLDRIIGSAKSKRHIFASLRVIFHVELAVELMFMNCGEVGSNSMGADLTCRWHRASCIHWMIDNFILGCCSPLMLSELLEPIKDIQLST